MGPADPLRSVDADSLYPAALEAAGKAGVTRLADITRLDRIGLPVWQAIRPMSRALSVHQGKGASSREAALGALLEAIDSNAAEEFSDCAVRCAFDDLPASDRAPCLDDFADDRASSPPSAGPVDWVAGEALPGCANVLLPLPVVSLDLTGGPTLFDRSSNGVASGATREEAVMAALHELIERDAMVEWRALDIAERMAGTLDPATIPFTWFSTLNERIEAAGASLACYLVPSITGTPVFACEINDPTKSALPFRATAGHAAHPIPELALFKAVSEACQSRAAFISGSRDDLFPWLFEQAETAITVAFGLPLPPRMEGVDFHTIAPGPDTLGTVCGELVRQGYSQATSVTLAEPAGLVVTRVFVSGLGSIVRRRRAMIG